MGFWFVLVFLHLLRRIERLLKLYIFNYQGLKHSKPAASVRLQQWETTSCIVKWIDIICFIFIVIYELHMEKQPCLLLWTWDTVPNKTARAPQEDVNEGGSAFLCVQTCLIPAVIKWFYVFTWWNLWSDLKITEEHFSYHRHLAIVRIIRETGTVSCLPGKERHFSQAYH